MEKQPSIQIEEERVCSICFKKLSTYNKSNECFSHSFGNKEEEINLNLDNLTEEELLLLQKLSKLSKEELTKIMENIGFKLSEGRFGPKANRGRLVSKKMGLDGHDKYDS